MALRSAFGPTIRGRDAELALVGELLGRVRSGSGAVLLIEGAAGMGKSRLIGEGVTMAQRLSFPVGIGAAEPSESVAELAPLLRALLLGVRRARAESMAAAHDEPMSRCILDLYRSATPNVSADWGAALTGPTRAPGLVVLPSADPFNDEALPRAIAGQLGARTQRLDGLGHSWMVEDPKATARVLRRFWSSIATG